MIDKPEDCLSLANSLLEETQSISIAEFNHKNLAQSFTMPLESSSLCSERTFRTFADKTSKTNWIEALVAVKFDLTHGQTVEAIESIDSSHLLSKSLQKKICFLSLPDHNTGAECDLIYTFRIRSRAKKTRFLYCYTFFRQLRDDTSPRGYFQKSLVVVSKLPYVDLLEKVVRVLGPLYFEFGDKILTEAISDINKWELLQTKTTYNFILVGSNITFHSPKTIHKQVQLTDSETEQDAKPTTTGAASITDDISIDLTLAEVFAERNRYLNGGFTSKPLFSIFGSNVTSLWHLWELVLIGEPLLVLAATPQKASNAVLALISLISPLNYSADFRPYFTIYDDDFEVFSHRTTDSSTKSVILGVTNPYFLKAYAKFPNLITLPKDYSKQDTTKVSFSSELSFDNKVGVGSSSTQNTTDLKFLERDYVINNKLTRKASISSDVSSSKTMKRIGFKKHRDFRLLKMSNYTPKVAKPNENLDSLLKHHDYEESVVFVRAKSLTEPDHSVLNQLFFYKTRNKNHTHSHVSLNNQILRQHFHKLTSQFLKPLELFLDFKQVSARKAKKHLGLSFTAYNDYNLSDTLLRFNVTKFLKFLRRKYPDSNLELYRKFILGPNFKHWYVKKVSEIDEQLRAITRHLRFNIDALSLLKNVKQEYKLSERIRRRKRKSWLGMKKEDEIMLELFRFKTPEAELIRRIEDAIKYEKRNKNGIKDKGLVSRMEKHLKDVRTINTLGQTPTVNVISRRNHTRSQSLAVTKN